MFWPPCRLPGSGLSALFCPWGGRNRSGYSKTSGSGIIGGMTGKSPLFPRTGIPLQAEVSFSYPEYPGLPARPLFADLHLELAPGRIHLIFGAADSGKTTLSRILSGLIPRHTGGVFSGRILWDGLPVEELDPRQLILSAGLLFQNPEEQIFSPRCLDEAAFALESLGVPPEEIHRRAVRALEWMGMGDFRDRNPGTLSGGEQKRLLAAALRAQDPAVWILDEIFEELDQSTRHSLLDYLRKENKTALIFASKVLPLFQDLDAPAWLLRGGQLLSLPEDPLLLEEELAREGPLFRPGSGTFREGLPETDGAPPLQGGEESPPFPAPGTPLLTLRGIGYAFPGGDFRLEVPELEIRAGETVALLGPNGAGKSTLARILCGLIVPGEGEILSGLDEDLPSGQVRPERLKRICGYLFQNPDYQLFLPTVEEELLYGLSRKGRTESRKEAARAAEVFRLPSLEAPPALLSYGSRKRLQGALGFMASRPVLILDEGDSGVSYRDYLEMISLLSRPFRALVLITHQEELARHLAARIFRMEEGRLREVPL